MLSFGLAILTSIHFIPDFTSHYEVTFIDVDQGDCTLIRNGKSNILIDTGGKKNVDLAKNALFLIFENEK